VPRRLRLSRKKGWRLPAGAVNVARPSRWGNPFRVGAPGVPDVPTAVASYRRALEAGDPRIPAREEIRAALRGKDLACWCALDGPCHADVLLDVANS
jgi:hypothetical protein